MFKKVILTSTVALGALLSGCVGTGPNTQNGAVTGGALGALAGAIIGHNSHGGNTLGGALIGGAAGALAGGTLGNAKDHEQGSVYGGDETAVRTRTYRVVQQVPPPPPPPPVNETVTTAPAANAVWIQGYWSYDGNSYAWVPSHWEIPPPNSHSYVAAHWENQGSGYFYIPAYWR